MINPLMVCSVKTEMSEGKVFVVFVFAGGSIERYQVNQSARIDKEIQGFIDHFESME